MDDKRFEDNIRDSLLKGTEESQQLKEQVWRNIQSNIYTNKKEERSFMKNKGNDFVRKAAGLAAAFMVLVAVLAATTTTGQAAMKRIIDILVPQKNITQELEGQKEKGKFFLHTRDEAVDYAIYIDEERYVVEKGEAADRIVPKVKAGGKYPAVFMEIKQIKDKKPEDLMKQTKAGLKAKYPTVRDEGIVEVPLSAYMLYANSGNRATDEVVKYYFVDNGAGGTFVIMQQYFIEASEGHGARFDNMLKEFRIVDLSK